MSKEAAEAGLGGVRRVHRQHRGRPEWGQLAPWIFGFAMAEGVVAAFDWRYIFLLPVLVYLGLACRVYLVPLSRADGRRRWFAVCEGGLLVWSRGDVPSIAIPWDALTTPDRGAKGAVVRLSWREDAEERSMFVGPVTARGDLARALEKLGPVRASPRPRLAVGAGGVAVLALVWWIVQPWVVPAVLGERPGRLQDLARLCWQQDRPFERAAKYEGAGPHPLVFFRESAGPPELATTGDGDRRPAPDQVELVACSHPAGRVSDKPINVCLYEGGLRTETYQGRRSLDIYEASTGRRVARQMMDGQDEKAECPPYQVVYGNDPDPEPRQGDTAPPLSDYEAVLRPFLTGAPRS
ncbi:hypothetical protein E1281_24890 [Actinomadura sp. KC345]|uniref:hypothetical protein n=1 Tax=Actinomadura sp. KC345 TaxID=2530371 RepID=UPI00104FE3F6|nr:hypothetical protein [Actinomadura sp. KC345]TDC48391.1 hypothetical protein E1281_24890 [Actinomadura sp. KC345]